MSWQAYARRIAAAWGLVFALFAPGAASAGFVYGEAPPGTGSSIGTAQDTYDPFQGLDAITGTLNAVVPQSGTAAYEVDVYRILISGVTTFSARTVSANPQDDFALFLFDSLGNAVYMNDDDGTSTMALLPAADPQGPLVAGFYYLAVALGGFDALDAGGFSLFAAGGFTDVRGSAGAGPLDGWTDTFARLAETPFDYRIEFTGAGIPEPATLFLAVLALLAAGVARRGGRST